MRLCVSERDVPLPMPVSALASPQSRGSRAVRSVTQPALVFSVRVSPGVRWCFVVAAQLLVIRSQRDLVTDSHLPLSISFPVSCLFLAPLTLCLVFVPTGEESPVSSYLNTELSVSAKSVSQASCVNSIFRQFLLREHTLGSLVSGKCRDGLRISVFFLIVHV